MERVNPSGVTYSSGAIPLATPAKSSIRKFYPSNGRTFKYDGVNIIQLPLAAEGQFLDAASHSFLKFDMVFKSNTAGQEMRMGGGGAHCWIDRMRILSATGQQLEDIQDYNVLHSMLTDLTCSPDHISTVLATRSGASARLIGRVDYGGSVVARGSNATDQQAYIAVDVSEKKVTFSGDSGFAYVPSAADIGRVLEFKDSTGAMVTRTVVDYPEANKLTLDAPAIAGADFTSQPEWVLREPVRREEADDAGMESIRIPESANPEEREVTRTYCINPVSGLLMQPKYIPLLMTKGGIQLEFVLADPKNALVTGGEQPAGVPSYEIKNVEYIAELIDFGPEFNSNFIQMMAGVGGALMSGVTYRNHTSTLNEAGTSVDISERARSIKSIFTILRLQTDIGDKEVESLRNRRCPTSLNGYQYRVGSVTYPDHFVKVQSPIPTFDGELAHGTAAAKKLNCAESYSQTLKALGNALTDVRHGSLVTPHNWLQNKKNKVDGRAYATDADDGHGVSTEPGTFVMACSFESFAKDSSKLESGLNSAAQSLPVELSLDTKGPLGADGGGGQRSTGDYRVNAFVCCDAMFNFLPNGDVISSI